MALRYFKCLWHHESADLPIVFFSEIDPDGWETRKIEIFADGSKGYASENEEHRETRLGLDRVPSLSEINSDPQFAADLITSQEFELEWIRRNEKVE